MVIYLYGKNSFAINRQLGLIKSRYLSKTGQEGDYSRVDIASKGIGGLLENLATVPMFVSSRLILVDGISLAKPTPEQLSQLVDSTPISTNLVLIDSNPDKRTAVFKQLSKLDGAKEYKILERYDLVKWVKLESSRLGAIIDPKVVSYLIDYVGQDQWTLHNELIKLSSYSKTITKETIAELATESIESTSFDLAEALVGKDIRRCIILYKQLTTQGVADQLIIGAITYQFRVLMVVVINNPELTKAYRLSPYPLQKARAISGGLEIADIKKAYALIARADIAIKTGQLASPEAVTELIYRLCEN